MSGDNMPPVASFPENSIHPQPGPQEQFLASPADVVVYGGAAGGGKTYALLLEPLRHVTRVRGYGAVIFRRTYPEITMEGSLWDMSGEIYPLVGAVPRESGLEWFFPPYNNRVKFAHLEYEKDLHDYQGSQICMLGFDQLEHFTEHMFFYMLSRNRSTCGVRPYVRATCNPDPDSWLASFLSWWIDQESGYPIRERSGVLRWFIRLHDEIVWASSPGELTNTYGPSVLPLSATFIPALIEDNKILLQKNPGYLASLNALPRVEYERLRMGNWKIRAMAGTVFKREWCEIVDTAPRGLRMVRYWDLAGTEPSPTNKDPDYTVGLLMGTKDGVYYVLDVVRVRKRPGDVENLVRSTAMLDGPSVEIRMEQEPGSSGVKTIEDYARLLAGYIFTGERSTGDKVLRCRAVASAAQHGLIKILRAPWNTAFISELEAFPTKGVHDDQVDALSGAFEALATQSEIYVASGNRKW